MLRRTTFWCKRTTMPAPTAAAGCAMGMLAMDAMGMRAMAGALVRARMEPAPMALLPRTRTALHSAMRGQRRDILLPIPQRRDRNRKHIQPVIKITPESPKPYLLQQIAIRGSNDPDIRRNHHTPANPLDLFFLQSPQQLGL